MCLTFSVNGLNADNSVHGILIQLPLPPHIDQTAVINSVLPMKDVDGLHSDNAAKLLLANSSGTEKNKLLDFAADNSDFHIPCTPLGCLELLDRSAVDIEGSRVVVIGRSNLVGIPMALLLMQRNATVTIAHSRTKRLDDVVKEADIVVAAVGRARMVQASWLKPGAVVIDVGINSIPDPTKKSGSRLVGDVDFEGCREVASLITPVPGGVGPMTIAMLLRNTISSAYRALQCHG